MRTRSSDNFKSFTNIGSALPTIKINFECQFGAEKFEAGTVKKINLGPDRLAFKVNSGSNLRILRALRD